MVKSVSNLYENMKGKLIFKALFFVMLVCCSFGFITGAKAANEYTLIYKYDDYAGGGYYDQGSSLYSNLKVDTGYKINWSKPWSIYFYYIPVDNTNLTATRVIMSNRKSGNATFEVSISASKQLRVQTGSSVWACGTAMNNSDFNAAMVTYSWDPSSHTANIKIENQQGTTTTTYCSTNTGYISLSGATSNSIVVHGDHNTVSPLPMRFGTPFEITEKYDAETIVSPLPQFTLKNKGYAPRWKEFSTSTDYITSRSMWQDHSIYAGSEPLTYTVTLDGGGSTISVSPSPIYYRYNSGNNSTTYVYSNSSMSSSYRISSLSTLPTKTGYTFGGYYTEPGGAGTQYIDSSGTIDPNIRNNHNDNVTSYTLYPKWTIATPATPTLSASKSSTIYNSSDITLTCGNQTSYSSDTTVYYRFGVYNAYVVQDWSTSNTYVIPKNEYVGARQYGCEVYATDGTYTSSTATSGPTTVTINNAKMTFNAGSGATITGTSNTTSTLYSKYGVTSLYTGVTNTTIGTVPTATKTGYTFKGWYTAASGGSKVINADGTTVASVSGWTNASKQFLRTTNSTLYAQFIQNPATPTITGGETKIYNSTDTTLTCATTTTYASGITKYYQFGYATSDGGTSITWLGSASTTATYTVDKNAYVGQRWYSCRVYASDGTVASSTVASATTADQEVRINNVKMSFDAGTNGGVLPGGQALYNNYVRYGSANIYTSITGSSTGTIPVPTKTGFTFAGWYTAPSGGTKIINADKSIVASVPDWTNSSKQFIRITDSALYAQFTPNTYTVTLNNQDATNTGTTKVWYQYKTTKTISDSTCYYYTNSGLSTCLSGSAITLPTKTGYKFKGYYTEPNGEGTQYVNSDGVFINNIYKKLPSEINSSYTDDITLYAAWELNIHDVTYDYQMNRQFNGSNDSYYDTGYIVDFDKNFEIEETFRVDELNKKYLIFGSYDVNNSSDKMLQVVVNYTSNKVLAYVGSLSGSKTSTGTITAGEDITAKLTWNADAKSYVLTLKGTITDITIEGTRADLSGKCAKTLRLGYDRERADGYWSPIKVSNFKITDKEIDGTVLAAFPEIINGNKYLAWYNSIIDENRATTITVDEDKTLYARDIPIYKVNLDNKDADTEGTTGYYYAHNISRVIDGTTCYYYTDSNLENCIVSADFVLPTKENNNFGGYYSKENGEGAQYITAAGVFTNNIYKKKPVDINEDYFDTITLYAKWSHEQTLTYDYNIDESLSFDGAAESFFDTGYTVNFNKDFEIDETFKVDELDKHYFLIGSYHSTYNSNKYFQISVNTDNTIRVYNGSTSNYIDSTETINANENINLKFSWNAKDKTYTLTAKGTVTDITMNGTYSDLTGSAVRTLRLGYDRGRASGYFSPITISSLKISNEEDYGNVITALPNASKEGYKLGWYDEATGGNKLDMYTVDGNKTLYAQWIEQKNLTYNYQINESFDGTAESKFNTGYQLNFNKDFEIEETFRVSELGVRNLIISSIYQTERPAFMIEKNAANKLRVYMRNELSSSHDVTSEETMPANEDITVKFIWNAGSKTYTITATGATTNISFSDTYEIKGLTNRTLTLGQDHRPTTDFGPVTVKSLKITESEDINSEVSELPETTKNGAKLTWFTASSDGDKVSSITMNDDKTIYADWEETANLTYDYIFNSPLSFTGGDESYFDTDYTIDWGKDFEIEETVKLPELGKRYLIFGGYKTEADLGNRINVEFTASGNIRIFGKSEGGYVTDRQDSTGTLYANEDITVKFTWNSGTQTFTITAQGEQTDMIVSSKMTGMTGKATRSLRLGQDYRGAAVYAPMEVSSFKATTAEEIGTVITDLPEVTVGGTELKWYDADFGGNEVTMHTLEDDATIYGHFPVYKVILSSEDADTPGTTEVYYEYNVRRTIDDVTCYYYSDKALTNCITNGKRIEIPEKANYNFIGYYPKENGTSISYVNELGDFINSLYVKHPNEIDSSYTDSITLYSKWSHEQTLAYDYNIDEPLTFNGTLDSFFDTGYTVNFDKDFEIEETFKLDELNTSRLVLGGFHLNYSSNKFLQVVVRSDNALGVYMGTQGNYKISEGTVSAGENITLKLSWNAATKTYTLTAKGTNTDITMSETYSDLTGSAVRTLRLGADRGRSSAYYGPIEVSSLKISNESSYGEVITALPNASKEGYRLGWYDEATGGNKIEMYTVEDDMTLYAQWIEQKKLTYDYGINESFDGTAESFFNTGYKINFDKDFEIEETFRLSELDRRNLIIGSYYSTSSANKPVLNIEVTAANKLRVYMLSTLQSSAHSTESTETVPADEDITIKYIWNAATNTYTVTATGATTNISMTGSYEVIGLADRAMRLGQDQRTATTFGPITISSLKITESEDENAVISELPAPTRDGDKLEWYTSSSEGDKVTSVTMDDNKTIYANWTEQKELTYEYQNDNSFDGTDESYFDTGYVIDWNKDFEIEETFRISKLNKKYLLIGSYESSTDKGQNIDVYITTDNKVYVYVTRNSGGNNSYVSFSGQLVANEDINFKFVWEAGEQRYTVTLIGHNTNFSYTNRLGYMVGKASHTLRLGQDHRGYSAFEPIEVKNLKIKTKEIEGIVVDDFPVLTKKGHTANWYDASEGGNVVTSITMDNNKTVYANLIPNTYSITLNNGEDTNTIYYQYNASKEIDGSACYYFANEALTQCIDNITPEKENYTFDGYYTEANGEGTKLITSEGEILDNLYQKTPDEINSSYTDNIELYANWIGKEINVTKPDGSIEVKRYGDKYDLGTNEEAKASDIISTVTFKYQDGRDDTQDNVLNNYTPNGFLVNDEFAADDTELTLTENIVIEYNYDEEKEGIEFSRPERDGYAFLGWFTDSAEGERVTSYDGNKDKIFYAHWEEFDSETQVTVDWDGEIAVYEKGTTVDLDKDVLKEYDEDLYTVNIIMNRDGYSDKELKIKKHYTRDHYLINGLEHQSTGQYTFNENTTIESVYSEEVQYPSLAEYDYDNLIGFFDSEEGGNEVTTLEGIDEDVTLYAHWNIEYVNVSVDGEIIGTKEKGTEAKVPSKEVETSSTYLTFDYDTEDSNFVNKEAIETIVTNELEYYTVNDTRYNPNDKYVYNSDVNFVSHYAKEIELDETYTEFKDNNFDIGTQREENTNNYYLEGWYTEESGQGTKIDFDNLDLTSLDGTLENPVVLYANWVLVPEEVEVTIDDLEPYDQATGANLLIPEGKEVPTTKADDTFNITFDYNDGTDRAEVKEASRSYTFNHYEVDGTGNYQRNDVYTFYKDVLIESVYDIEYTYPEIPTIDNPKFKGFYTLPEGGSKVEDLNDITEDTTLYAQYYTGKVHIEIDGEEFEYDKGYALTLEENSYNKSIKVYLDYNYYDQKTVNITSNYVIENYTDKDNLTYNPGDVYICENDNVFTSNYTSNKANDFTGYSENPWDIGMSYIDENGVTYNLAYWSNSRKIDHIDLSELTTDSDNYETYYAVWEKESYTVTYYDTILDEEISTTDFESGNSLGSLPEHEKEDYIFEGWYKEDTFVNRVSAETTVLSDMTLYGKWIEDTRENPDDIIIEKPDGTTEIVSKNDPYQLGTNDITKEDEEIASVTFDYQDGITPALIDYVTKTYTPNGWLVNDIHYDNDEEITCIDDLIVIRPDYTEEVTSPTFPDVTRENYTFEGWFDLPQAGNEYTEYTGSTDRTFYAQYIGDEITITKPDNTIEVKHYGDTYDLGTNDVIKADDNGALVTFDYNDGVTPSTTDYVVNSYTPSGWLVNNEAVANDTVLTLTDNITIEYNYDVTRTSPTIEEPEAREHYTFDGWFDEDDNKVTSYNGEEDITLYAHWIGDEITVTKPDETTETKHYGDTYDLGTNEETKANENGASITFKYQDGETADETLYVIKSFTPNGWLVDGEPVADDTILTLTDAITINYNYTETLTSPTFIEPTRDNYTFDGWFDEDDNKVTSYNGTEDITLYAHWTLDKPTDFDIDNDEIYLMFGDTYQMEVTFTPDGTTDNLVFSEYDHDMLAISSTGLITGLAPGTATVTVALESNPAITKEVTITVLDNEIVSETLTVATKEIARIIIGEEPKTKIEDFLSKIDNPAGYLKVYDKDDTLIEDYDTMLTTGMKVKLVVNDHEYDETIVIIRGDIDEDGQVQPADNLILKDHLLKKSYITGYKLYAADVDEEEGVLIENAIKPADNNKLMNYLLKKSSTLNN